MTAIRKLVTRTSWIIIALLSCAAAVHAAGGKSVVTPRLNGHPDLNGTWENGGGIDFVQPVKKEDGSICVRDCGGPPPPRAPQDRPTYKPEFAAKVKDLNDRQVQLDPALRCKPPGVPRIGPPDKIVQTAKEVIFLYEDIAGAAFRVVTLGAKHSLDDIEPSYFGHSVGRWDGDTLIVDTIGFNDDTWMGDNGLFHTPNLRVTERLKRVGNKIEFNVVVDDPNILTEPWHLRPRVLELSNVELPPSIPCVEQDLSHVVDGTHHDNLR